MRVATKWAEVAGTKMSECLCFIYAMLPERQEQANQSLFWDFRQYFQDPRSTANIVFRPDASNVLCILVQFGENSSWTKSAALLHLFY